jgi:hypothetical protein
MTASRSAEPTLSEMIQWCIDVGAITGHAWENYTNWTPSDEHMVKAIRIALRDHQAALALMAKQKALPKAETALSLAARLAHLYNVLEGKHE